MNLPWFFPQDEQLSSPLSAPQKALSKHPPCAPTRWFEFRPQQTPLQPISGVASGKSTRFLRGVDFGMTPMTPGPTPLPRDGDSRNTKIIHLQQETCSDCKHTDFSILLCYRDAVLRAGRFERVQGKTWLCIACIFLGSSTYDETVSFDQ